MKFLETSILNKTCERLLQYIILIEWTFYGMDVLFNLIEWTSDICQCGNTTGDNGTVQFVFFLAMRLNIIIEASVTLFIIIVAPYFS